MKRTLPLVFTGFLLAALASFGQATQDNKASQESKSDKPAQTSTLSDVAEDAQRLTTGQITKIDAKKKILTVREAPLNEPATAAPNSNSNSRNGGMGGGGMGGRRRGGMGTGYPGGGSSTPKPQGKEFKVTVTDKTAIKDSVTSIGFDLLRVGDRISIQGLPKGKGEDLQATQITVSQ